MTRKQTSIIFGVDTMKALRQNARWTFMVTVAVAASTAACSQDIECGPGTELVDGACLPISAAGEDASTGLDASTKLDGGGDLHDVKDGGSDPAEAGGHWDEDAPYSRSGPSSCGNGVLEPGEFCDLTANSGESCGSLGLGEDGSYHGLMCNEICLFETVYCSEDPCDAPNGPCGYCRGDLAITCPNCTDPDGDPAELEDAPFKSLRYAGGTRICSPEQQCYLVKTPGNNTLADCRAPGEQACDETTFVSQCSPDGTIGVACENGLTLTKECNAGERCRVVGPNVQTECVPENATACDPQTFLPRCSSDGMAVEQCDEVTAVVVEQPCFHPTSQCRTVAWGDKSSALCVHPQADPCDGTQPSVKCVGDVLLRCGSGTQYQTATDCSIYGDDLGGHQTCLSDPSTHSFGCGQSGAAPCADLVPPCSADGKIQRCVQGFLYQKSCADPATKCFESSRPEAAAPYECLPEDTQVCDPATMQEFCDGSTAVQCFHYVLHTACAPPNSSCYQSAGHSLCTNDPVHVCSITAPPVCFDDTHVLVCDPDTLRTLVQSCGKSASNLDRICSGNGVCTNP